MKEVVENRIDDLYKHVTNASRVLFNCIELIQSIECSQEIKKSFLNQVCFDIENLQHSLDYSVGKVGKIFQDKK